MQLPIFLLVVGGLVPKQITFGRLAVSCWQAPPAKTPGGLTMFGS